MGMLKVASVLIALVLLVSLAALAGVSVVEANFMPLNIPPHGIEITADGNVTGTESIMRRDADYEFTGNISGNIVVFCDNITINGNGYWLEGNGDFYGIFLEGRKNVTVKNLTISNFEYGAAFSYGAGLDGECKDHRLIANNIINNKWGIYCYHVSNITIYGNLLANNSNIGISNFNSEQIQIYGNTLADNNASIRFTYCHNNNVYGNSFINNTSIKIDAESKSGLVFGWSTINWNNKRLGNFWSDYTGIDANKDGIGDTPYTIDSNNTDHYPLMSPINDSSLIQTLIDSEPETPLGIILTAVIVVVLAVLSAVFLLYRKKHRRYFLMDESVIQPKKG
jgi:nitrous oxidase accessory protein NosD